MSALITPTNVTLGNRALSRSFASPDRICISPCRKLASAFSWLPGFFMASESIRKQVASAKRERTSASSRCVPRPAVANSLEPAFGADRRSGGLEIAVVADRNVFFAMVCQCDIAVAAGHDLAAGWTLDVRREPASIQQQNDLAAITNGFGDRLIQRPTDGSTMVTALILRP